MPEQYESLNEKARMIDISMKYTNGDVEKAKSMAAGFYHDNMAVKIKFYNGDRDESGLVLAFFNTENEFIANVSSVVVSNGSIFEKIRVFADWKSIYNDINAYRSGEDVVDIPDFNGRIVDYFVKFDIFPQVNEKNIDAITVKIADILKEIYDGSKTQCQVEIDTASSLAMELADVSIELPDSGTEASGDAASEQIAEEDERITQIENEADYVVEGKVLVAPVKGKYINDINTGEKIKVILTSNDMISEKVLKTMNAIDENGERYAINGRVKAKIPLEPNGYIIYALVAKGILVKVIEEENVKIMVERPVEEAVEVKQKESKILYLMALIVGLIILTGLILLSVM